MLKGNSLNNRISSELPEVHQQNSLYYRIPVDILSIKSFEWQETDPTEVFPPIPFPGCARKLPREYTLIRNKK